MNVLLGVCFVVALCSSAGLSVSVRGSSHDLEFSKGKVRVGDIWSDCSSSDDRKRFVIKNVTIDPDPPQAGKDVTVTATYQLFEQITGGVVNVTAKDEFIPLLDKSYSICSEVSLVGKKCPLAPDNNGQVSITESLPDITIPGTIKAHAVAADQNGNELACVDIEVKV